MFAWDVGVREVIFECDSTIVAEALKGLSGPPTAISNIIEGIRHKLQDFRQVHISHVRWQGNRPTHILAQYTWNIVSYVTWIEENPNMIELALAQDVLFLFSS